MASLTPTAARYRLQLLRAYTTHEKAAVRTVSASSKQIVDALVELDPKSIRDLTTAMRVVDGSLAMQRSGLARTMTAGSRDIASITMRYHQTRSGRPLFSKAAVERATKQASRAIVAGKNVGDRITLLGGAQRSAARIRLLQGLRKGEKVDKIAAAIERYYVGAVDGSAGPSYAAKRLVQSELTRLNGLVAEETAYRLRKEAGVVTVFSYHTQGDDRVRDEHADLEGEEFAEDVLADDVDVRPISEAHAALSEPNCRCWLDVESYEQAA